MDESTGSTDSLIKCIVSRNMSVDDADNDVGLTTTNAVRLIWAIGNGKTLGNHVSAENI